MKTLQKTARLCAIATLVMVGGQAMAQNREMAADGGTRVDNWTSGDGSSVWKTGDGTQCWRNANWTPATAAVGCDGALVAQVAEPVMRAPLPAAPPAQSAVAPVATKVTFAGDAFFDFDQSVIKPAGKVMLDELAKKLNGVDLEVMIVVGHADSVGTESYNLKLSERRAKAVRAYLVSKGILPERVLP